MKRRVYTYLQLFKEGLIESLAGIVNIHRCVTAAIADVLGINHNYTGNRLITKAWAINQDEPDDPDPINPDPINPDPEPQHTYEWEYAFSASTAVPVTGWVTLSSDTQLIYYNPNTPYLHFRMYCDNQLVNEDVQDYEIFYKNPSNNTIPTEDHLCTKVIDGPNRYYCEYDRTIESPMVRMMTSASGSTDNASWFYAFSTTADTPQQFVSIPNNNTIVNDSNYNYLWILCIDSDLNSLNIDPINNPSDYEAYIENNGTQIIYGPSEQYNYWNKVDVSGLSGAINMQLRKSSEVQTNITYRSQLKWYYGVTIYTDAPQSWTRLTSDISLPRNTNGYLWFKVDDDNNNANDYEVSDGSAVTAGQYVHLLQGYTSDISYSCTFDNDYVSPNITLLKNEATVVLDTSHLSDWTSQSPYYVRSASAQNNTYPVEIFINVYYSAPDEELQGYTSSRIEIPVTVDGESITIQEDLSRHQVGETQIMEGTESDISYKVTVTFVAS